MFAENIQQIEIQKTEEIYLHLSGKSLFSFETILVCRRIVRSALRRSLENSQFLVEYISKIRSFLNNVNCLKSNPNTPSTARLISLCQILSNDTEVVISYLAKQLIWSLLALKNIMIVSSFSYCSLRLHSFFPV